MIRPIEVIPNRINTKIALLFISQTLAFSNPRLLPSFVSMAFKDVEWPADLRANPKFTSSDGVPPELNVLGFR